MAKRSTIMIIDDDPLTRKVVRVTLNSDGYSVLEAEDGRAALDLVGHYTPDLILLDLVLPDVDGIELVKPIRALLAATVIPILAFSAFPSKLDQARHLEVGFQGYILKPIEPSRLLGIIHSHSASGEGTLIQPGRGKSVLVVDDDPLQRKLLKLHLEQLGFAVNTAVDGQDGLEQARRSPPDAIISDMLMPRLDGFRFCLAVRQEQKLPHIPVVLTSAVFHEKDDERLAASVGATAFVLRTPDLREVIETLLSSLEQDVPATESVTELPAVEYAERIAHQLSNQAVISTDLGRRLEWLEAKLALLAGLAETTKRDVPAELITDDILRRALESAGATRGAAYLLRCDGQLELRAEIGYEGLASRNLSDFFGCADLLSAAMDRREPSDVPSAHDASPSEGELLRKSGARAMLITPLIYQEVSLGVLAIECGDADKPLDRHFITATVTNQVSQAIALIRALAERRRAEEERARLYQETQKLNEELQNANKELEAFSYSISHDLRAPLRAINGFSRILLEDNMPQLPPQAREHLQFVCEGAEQMGRLIDGLLTFSRLGRQPLSKLPLNTDTLAREVLRGLQPEYEGRQVQIKIGELPPVLADPILLRQVFTNLLANAVKFTRNREVAEIEIGARLQDGQTVYFVRDNGAGFDTEYAHKLFGVFQRLHSVTEFEGTGVGLAIVKRIIQRHSGQIWAEGAIDAGATFYFTLGEKPEAVAE